MIETKSEAYKTYNRYGTVGETEYETILEDYKDLIITDFEKFKNDISKLAIEWNCQEFTMIKLLYKWGLTKRNNRNSITKEQLEEVYNRTKNIEETHKELKISYGTLHKMFREYGIKKFVTNDESETYRKIISDNKLLLEFKNYQKLYKIEPTAMHYNISRYYVRKILNEIKIKESEGGI